METDILIIGSGPAGMSAAQYCARAGYTTIIIDPMGPGGQLLYINEIENYPGSEKLSGYVLSERMEKQCESFGVAIDYTKALSIKKENGLFSTETDDGEITSKAVIVATGAVHRKLNVEGEEKYRGKGVSYCATCDGPFFKGKKVVVAGGGDTALTDALYLSSICSEVVVIHRRTSFRAQKVLQDRIKERKNISTVLGDTIEEILGDGKDVTGVKLQSGRNIECSGVFIFVGMDPCSDIVSSIVELDNGYIRTNGKNETSLKGLLAAGDVTTTSFRQVVTAASDGARAAHSADEYIRSL